jgi:predicted Zn finger-like uncharacterized protein
MIIQCEACSRKFVVKDEDIPASGRNVQCGYCNTIWFQNNVLSLKKTENGIKIEKSKTKVKENLSVDSIKGSDGKTYKFLGSQWAELLPSGKTGLFAKKKIGKELDKITGRKIKISPERKKKREKKELDPSSQSLGGRLPDIYKPSEGMGFFSYIFLLIIIGFSAVGILKTFENDLINNFPEIEYFFIILDEQLIFIAEAVKNIFTIFDDLINSY